jgi:hypothetical protein
MRCELVSAEFEIVATVDVEAARPPAGILWGTRFFAQTRQPGAYLEGDLAFVPETATVGPAVLASPLPRALAPPKRR